jgi:hypothetical protein
MLAPATLGELRAELRKTIGDPLIKRFADENLNQAIRWALTEACRMAALTTAEHVGTVPAGTNLVVLADPGLGLHRFSLEV